MEKPRPLHKFPWISVLILGAAFFTLPILPATIARGEIFGYQDSDGHWRFPGSGAMKHGFLKPESSQMSGEEFIQAYQGTIRKAAAMFGVEQMLIKAVIKAESDFDHHAVSRKGAAGLMQLMPETAREMMVENPFNPSENILGGTRYLASLLQRFHHNTALAVAAFNAGPGRVEKSGCVPAIRETRQFVGRVLFYYELFQRRSDERND